MLEEIKEAQNAVVPDDVNGPITKVMVAGIVGIMLWTIFKRFNQTSSS